jgi:hypothetical protein
VNPVRRWWIKRFGSDWERLTGNIAIQGWCVVRVSSDGSGPEFAYTIGLWKSFRHPELIIVGLPKEVCGTVVHGLAHQISTGERAFAPGGPYDHVLHGHPVYALEMRPDEVPNYLGRAMQYYLTEPPEIAAFSALQMVWPDRETGAFPWDAAWPQHYEGLQPLLGPAPVTTTIQ